VTGPPDWLRARLDAVLAGLGDRPDYDAAVAAVAARHGRPPEEVLLTGGAADAYRLIATTLRPRRAVCVYPLDAAPEAALRQAGHAVEQVKLAPPAVLDPDQLPADADLVVLAHHGTQPASAELVRRLATPGRILVADEALTDPSPGDEASLGGRGDLRGLIVVRGLAPSWGLAGLGAGYLLGDADTLGSLRDAQPAGLVSGLALAALETCSQPDAVAWADRQTAAETGLPAEAPPALPAPGTVTLIGAGPGGPDLITMRGWRALHAAEIGRAHV